MKLTTPQRLVAVALLGIFFAQTVTAIPQLSLTADEPVYMGAGYAFLQSKDLRLATSAQHPPFMQELVALPLFLQPGPELKSLAGWDTAEMVRYAPAFVAWYGDALDAATFVARMPVVWVAILWAAFLFRWAADWFGPWGGIVALTLFVFDPNILAHATLATNDVGFASFSFITLFFTMRLVRRPSRRYLVLAGLTMGVSLSTKSSGFFTPLVVATLLPLRALIARDRDDNRGRTRRLIDALLQLSLILCLGLFVLWATYGFEFRSIADGRLPVPMATHWQVWREMQRHLDTGHTAYLMGQIRKTGWLAYYPLTFALKTPPLTLALLAIGLIGAIAGGPRRWLAELPLWIYLGGYVSATLLSSVTTGYRFLLPVLPFGFILIAGLFCRGMSWVRLPAFRWGSWALITLTGVTTAVRLHPDYLTYFNFLTGGPTRGHRYLVDSNLDWGQSFKSLATYLDKQGITGVWLSYYTYADPSLYAVPYQPIAPSPGAPPVLPSRFNPAPGIYAIGATTLQGVMVADPDIYDWFRHQEPVSRPGTALFVYRVEASDEPPTWLAQCTVPVIPLSTEAAEEGFGQRELRMAYFDCTSAWLYPGGGESPGWYALFRDTARSDDTFVQNNLEMSRLSYEQRRAGALPSFSIFEKPSDRILPPSIVGFEAQVGDLAFLGHASDASFPVQPGQTVEVVTWWQVTVRPERPLSLMLHLVGPGGSPRLVADGLGVPVEQWQVGDVIAQRHQVEIPTSAPPGEYQLLTGAYWLDSLERWPILSGDQSGADTLILSPITVQP